MSIEQTFNLACNHTKEIPGVVLVASGPGNFRYAKAFGQRSLKPGQPAEPLRTDSIFWTASCTKLQTTVAALQCVEKGLLRLDDDATEILHEFRGAKVLKDFDSQTKAPIFAELNKKLTLRHLLTHTSGISYDHFSPVLQKYFAQTSRPISNGRTGKIAESYLYPLLFQPGTSWEYGAGIDWAGQMVERVTKMSLEQYFQQNIWNPLQMRDSTFRLHERPDLKERMMDMTTREGLIHPVFGTTLSPDGNIIHGSEGNKHVKVTDDFGGAGVYCSALDYATLLRSLCLNDEKLLRSESVDMMFTPQLALGSRARLATLSGIREVNSGFGGLPHPNEPMDFGLGGMMPMEDVPRRRKRGSLFWGGLPNLFWWMDRESGVSGIMATQLMPSGDPKCVEFMGKFEEAIYEMIRLEGERTRSREKL